MGAFGISTTPRDLARIGHLVLNGGLWREERIVSSEWIESMTSPQVSAAQVDTEGTEFGYYWWTEPQSDLVFMWGKGGQFVMVKRDKKLIVVMTAGPNDGHVFSLPSAMEIFDNFDAAAR